jgi:hypothetical protein
MAGSAGTVPLSVPQIGSRASALLAITDRTATQTAREPAYGTSGKTTAAASRAAHGSPVTRWPGSRISQSVSPGADPLRAGADLDAVPVPEGIARVIAAAGSKQAALISRFGVSDYAGDAEQQIGTLLQALLQRGIDDGTFRGDLSAGDCSSCSAACSRPQPG